MYDLLWHRCTACTCEPQDSLDVRPQWPPPCDRDACGSARRGLRDLFNAREIAAERVMDAYDSDKSGYIDAADLERLLWDYNSHRAPHAKDHAFLLLVADPNQADVISRAELGYALKAWFALTHMPAAVNATIQSIQPTSRALPRRERVRQILTALNDEEPVTDAEVSYVRSLLERLVSAGQMMTVDELRRAVAPWYISVKRSATPRAALAKYSMGSSSAKIGRSAAQVGALVMSPSALVASSFETVPSFCLASGSTGRLRRLGADESRGSEGRGSGVGAAVTDVKKLSAGHSPDPRSMAMISEDQATAPPHFVLPRGVACALKQARNDRGSEGTVFLGLLLCSCAGVAASCGYSLYASYVALTCEELSSCEHELLSILRASVACFALGLLESCCPTRWAAVGELVACLRSSGSALLWMVGMLWTLASSEAACGSRLHATCNVYYVTLPCACLALLCACALAACCGGSLHEFRQAVAIEQRRAAVE